MPDIVILEPTARPGIAACEAWRPLDTLAGKVVGFIDNSKPNFHLLADDLAELLVAKHRVASVVRHR
ncbi:MAG: UGSC family (seleno)protein, partial [Burkholderiales bacterium]